MVAPELATSLAPATTDERLLQAEAAVRAECGWHIAPLKATTEEVWPDGPASPLFVRTLQLFEVVSIIDDGEEVDLGDLKVDVNGTISRRCGSWSSWSSDGPVEVTFRHGYQAVPADVTAVVQQLAGSCVEPGVSSKKIGPYSWSYGRPLPDEIRDRLAAYVIVDGFA